MNINNKKKTILLIGILVLTMLIVSGGTFAYFRWISSEDQQTNLAIQIEENINMHIENPALEKTGMYPTNTCTNVAATMSGVSIIALENQTGVIARPKFKLRVKITDKNGNVITNNSAGSANSDNPYRYFINYAVAEENGTCTEPLYSGNFDQNAPTYQGQTQWYDSEWITLTSENTGFPLISNGPNTGVSFNGTPYQTTYHNYKVWVWIDESYVSVNTGDIVSDKLQDAKIELSWSENSTVEQIKAQAYAVFSSSEEGGDNSLRFYQSDEQITEDSTYAGRPVTAVYTGFETASYSSASEVPWYEYTLFGSSDENIEKVEFEDTITPISTAYWFANFFYCPSVDLTKLDTSNVTNMSNMFFNFGGIFTGHISITGMENWNVSNVTNMTNMFNALGADQNTTTITISDISGWDVSNVTNMNGMFSYFPIATLDLSSWNVYKVTEHVGFNLDSSNGLTPPNWYTSYAVYSNQDNSLRFYRTQTDLTLETEWNGLTVTNVYFGGNELDDGFEDSDYFTIPNVPWNGVRSNIQKIVVENEIYPISTAYWFDSFYNCSYIDVTKLNTSSVVRMTNMFNSVGSSVTIFTIEGVENFDTSNVTDMNFMFSSVGVNATNDWSLDLSNWDVSKVNSHYYFNNSVEDKIIAPNFPS